MHWGTVAAGLVTLAIFSFLYRDNPFYKAAEHILIGLSVGFTIVLLWSSVLVPKLFQPLLVQGKLWSIIPLLLCLLIIMRLKSSWSLYSRPVLALIIGAGAGLSIPAMLDARVLKQAGAAIAPFAALHTANAVTPWSVLEAIIGLIACLTVMVYFFYTRSDRGFSRFASQTGVYFLMIFFGATFGYTVTSRLTLLIGRIEFLLSDLLRLL